MALKFFNTLSRKIETFKPIKEGEVNMYTCGPTLYNFPHIGNYRAYLFEDQLRRYLEYCSFKVTQVMNLTDVDDKTIRDSRKEGVSLNDFTARYKKAFFEDLKTLNIEAAEVYPAATEHINDMVEMVKVLLDKSFAYKSDDGSVYFNVKKFKKYGKLAHIKVDELKAGARVNQDEYDKEQAQDFALWKAWDEGDGDVFWETEIGKGRPGWHIECSAMSKHYLGDHFDIHTGGVDNIFPHHENEIAQSEAVSGKKFVNYWIHCEHLLVDGKKMSKSAGNFYTLRDILSKGYNPLAVRYLLLSSHYRTQFNFTFEGLDAADSALKKLNDFVQTIINSNTLGGVFNENVVSAVKRAKDGFEKSMDDDLNISNALGFVFDFVHDINKIVTDKKIHKDNVDDIIELMKMFNSVLGVLSFEKQTLDEDIKRLVEQRELARKNRDFATSDKIRDDLLKQGVILEDTPEGIKWKKR